MYCGSPVGCLKTAPGPESQANIAPRALLGPFCRAVLVPKVLLAIVAIGGGLGGIVGCGCEFG